MMKIAQQISKKIITVLYGCLCLAIAIKLFLLHGFWWLSSRRTFANAKIKHTFSLFLLSEIKFSCTSRHSRHTQKPYTSYTIQIKQKRNSKRMENWLLLRAILNETHYICCTSSTYLYVTINKMIFLSPCNSCSFQYFIRASHHCKLALGFVVFLRATCLCVHGEHNKYK